MLNMHAIANTSLIIPVVVIEDETDALPLANALLEGGIKVCEITLRTPKALSAIEQISKNLPQMIIGAGSVLNISQYEDALKHGSQFIVSPGLHEGVIKRALEDEVPIMPGVMTPSEVMKGLSMGIELFKLFPASIAGGVDMLKAMSGPIDQAQFCPTGGVNLSNINAYLECPNVITVGGTWLTPKKYLDNKNFTAITDTCKKSLKSLKS